MTPKGVMKDKNYFETFKQMLFPQKVKVFILAKLGDTLKIVESGKAPSTIMSFNRKDRDYVMKLESAILDKDNTPILFYHVDDTNPLKFKVDEKKKTDGTKIQYNPRDVNTILKSKKLADKLGSGEQLLYWIIIAGLIIAVIGITAYSLTIQQQLLAEIAKLQEQLRGIIIL